MTLPLNQNFEEATVINDEFKDYILPVSSVFGVFSCIGILGNLFVLYVHIFKYKNCNFRSFVLGLCAVDLLSSVTILPLEIYTELNWYVFPSQWLCKLKAFLNAFTSIASVYVLLLIAIDRHRKICAPYSWQMTSQSVLIGYGICLFLTCCQCWPPAIVWGLQPGLKHYRGREVNVTVCSTDPSLQNTMWRKVFIILMCPHFLAMIVMLILYILVGTEIFGVVLTLRRQTSLKNQSPKSALKKKNTVSLRNKNNINPEGISSADTINIEGDRGQEPVDGKNDCHDESRICVTQQYADESELTECETDAKSVPSTGHSECQKSRKISTDSKESTDMELVIYEIQDNGICVKKSKIAKSSKKRKRSKRKSLKKVKTKQTESHKRRVRFSVAARDKLRRRTLITFVFTAIFIGTTIMYIIFNFRVAHENATQSLSFSQLAGFLFLYRLYFINSVIHPVLYGFLDPRFRKILKSASAKVMESVIRNIHETEHK